MTWCHHGNRSSSGTSSYVLGALSVNLLHAHTRHSPFSWAQAAHPRPLRLRHLIGQPLVHIKPGALRPWRRLQHAQQAGVIFGQHLRNAGQRIDTSERNDSWRIPCAPLLLRRPLLLLSLAAASSALETTPVPRPLFVGVRKRRRGAPSSKSEGVVAAPCPPARLRALKRCGSYVTTITIDRGALQAAPTFERGCQRGSPCGFHIEARSSGAIVHDNRPNNQSASMGRRQAAIALGSNLVRPVAPFISAWATVNLLPAEARLHNACHTSSPCRRATASATCWRRCGRSPTPTSRQGGCVAAPIIAAQCSSWNSCSTE